MTQHVDQDQFRMITSAIAGETVDPAWRAASTSIERLRIALDERPQRASALDIAVLLRQVLQFEYAQRNFALRPTVVIRHPRLIGFRGWDAVGLEATETDGGWIVKAGAWQPAWLNTTSGTSVDGLAASEVQRRAFNTADCAGDPFLEAIKRSSYRSVGQRAAVRAALSTPAGATLIVALPTGEGKSTIFQLVHRIGFVGAAQADRPGVTLVIVPTVALGVNHETEAVNVCGLSRPLAFQGGAEALNATIAERIAGGVQGLCFASPEAACGRLRVPLRKAAEAGHLRALVIDEAHLVDQWGTGFRTEFQELSGLRRELLAAAPRHERMRTLLLSATLTQSSTETLRALFGIDGEFGTIASVKLRPEPDYWVAKASPDATRNSRVLEALHHAPRPAVLYVTEVDHAIEWWKRLRATGFQRIGLLHGKTGAAERERIVGAWRDGSLDIVVGTSAFGLGIDYPHCRTVIHACVPETLDRFYQEVGRGGRDGRASLSLIVPSERDFAIAERINQQKIIGVDRGYERWSTMFARKLPLRDGRFAVRVDGRPGNDGDDIDMFGDANTDWNLRTLTLMARASFIKLLGTPHPRIEQIGDWIEVEISDDSHLDKDLWLERIEPVRRVASGASARNFELMRRYLEDNQCPARTLEALYGASGVARVCSSCSQCRERPGAQESAVPMGEPRAPWAEPLNPLLAQLFDSEGRLLVTYSFGQNKQSASRRLAEILEKLQRLKLAKLLLLGDQLFDVNRVLAFAKSTPFFVSVVPTPSHSRLPPGPELLLVGANQVLEHQNFHPNRVSPRILLTPEGQVTSDGRRLKDVFGGRTLTFDEFNSRVSQ